MTYEYILIDADDTLFDFNKAMENAVEKLYGKYGIKFSPENLEIYRTYNEECWRMLERKEINKDQLQMKRFELLINHMGLKNLDPAALNHDFITFLGEGSQLIPHALELCQAIKPGRIITIATNGIYRSQMARIENSDIIEYIDHIAVSEKAGFNKPDPEFFEYAFKICGCTDKSKAIMIGDSIPADISGGIAFGIATCWYNPAKKPLPQGIAPDYIVHDLMEIPDLV